MRFQNVIIRNFFRILYYIPRMKYCASHPDRYSEEDCYGLAKKIVRIIQKSGHITTVAYGEENLPEGGYVMYPNHQGKYDALGIMSTHEKPCSIVIDEKRSHAPVTSQFIDLLHGKRLQIGDPKQTVALFRELVAEIGKGRRFILFPEGGYENTRYDAGYGNRVEPFKPGSFQAAVRAKAPIVPVALIDSYRAFNGADKGPVTKFVEYLKPLFYEDYKEMRTADIASLVQGRIEEAIRLRTV